MNEHFISIKVDREERPDIDQIYMNCSHDNNWSRWLAFECALFARMENHVFAGTYFPRDKWVNSLLYFAGYYIKKIPQKIIDQADTHHSRHCRKLNILIPLNQNERTIDKTLSRNYLGKLET
jgi:hypothetical protein